jgi:hypothetical protein
MNTCMNAALKSELGLDIDDSRCLLYVQIHVVPLNAS